MENATKALLIAGAVLMAILLIALGMMVFNNSQEMIARTGTEIDEQTKQMFNSKFDPYEGADVLGSKVKSLISQVIATNGASEAADVLKEREIKVKYGGTEQTDLSSLRSKIKTSRHYSVTFTYRTDGQAGLISGIDITDVTDT